MNRLELGFFCIFFFLFLPLLGRDAGINSVKIEKDSLLNEVTDVDKRVLEHMRLDSIGSNLYRRLANSDSIDNYLLKYNRNRREDGILMVPDSSWIPFPEYINFNDTIIIDPIFLPIVFDGKILPGDLNFRSKDSSFVNPDKYVDYYLISPDSTFLPDLYRSEKIQLFRKQFYTTNPQDILYNGLVFDKNPVLDKNKIKRTSKINELFSPDNPISITMPSMETMKVKKSYWILQGTHSLQLSQNQVSDTWHAGGDNKLDLKNYHKIALDYKKDKITFNSRVEWKLNLQRSTADKIRNMGITDDYLNLYNVFGYQAYKNWSYSANITSNTPFFKGYKINTSDRLRNFLSPLDLGIGIGLRYSFENVSKKDKYKNTNLSLDLSPLSIEYRYIKDTLVINGNTNYGLDAGKHTKFDIGSKVILNFTCNFNRYANWTSSLTLFTNYERVQIDMSNRFNYALNRYFSITADLVLRFDDSVNKKDKTFGFLQYNETLSLGFSYTW